jgi:nitrite reductase (NADH) small subunit/3-phenylpropionate/trans-cinnamate dioxygenase ferredoxin subunit
MAEFVTVAKVDEIPVGEGRAFPVNDQMIAVFNEGDGQFRAIDDACPHQGASLAEGYVEGGEVACPWHAWRFKLCNGAWADNPRLRVNAYQVRIAGDKVQVCDQPIVESPE